MFEKDVYNYFNLMISKFFKYTNSIYDSKLSDEIVSILLNNDEKSKQLFFDFFKNVSSNDKEKIVKTCIYEVINRINYIIRNSNKNKINYITNYIESFNRNLVINIHNYFTKGDANGLTDYEIIMLNDLSENEVIVLDSLCLNLISFNYNSIEWDLNFILKSKQNFTKNIMSCKSVITELFKFYIPIYGLMSNFKSIEFPFEIPTDKNYVKIYPMTEVIKNNIIKQNDEDNILYSGEGKSYIYYMIYQFIISISYNKGQDFYINNMSLILDLLSLNIDYNTYKIC